MVRIFVLGLVLLSAAHQAAASPAVLATTRDSDIGQGCAAQPARPDLRVSVTVLDDVRPLQVGPIVKEVDRIWSRLGVRFDWRGAAGTGATPSGDQGIDVRVQVLAAFRGGVSVRSARRVLAHVLFDGDQPLPVVRMSTRETLITLTEAFEKRGERFQPTLGAHVRVLERALARTLAHELGHIILRVRTHSRTGLMQASLPARDLMADEVDLTLDAPHASALQMLLSESRTACASIVAAR